MFQKPKRGLFLKHLCAEFDTLFTPLLNEAK